MAYYKQIKVGVIPTSETEIRDLIKAWIAISLAFAIIISRSFSLFFYSSFIISSITVGAGFLLHELGHKIVAQRFGCFAEFRASNFMLIFAIIIAFLFGIVFAAPGAVMIFGPVGRRRNGMISLAGPATNLVLALIFFSFLFLNPTGLIKIITVIGFFINSILAMFNMLPFGNLDGKKILRWNKTIYYTFFISSILLFFVSQQFMIV